MHCNIVDFLKYKHRKFEYQGLFYIVDGVLHHNIDWIHSGTPVLRPPVLRRPAFYDGLVSSRRKPHRRNALETSIIQRDFTPNPRYTTIHAKRGDQTANEREVPQACFVTPALRRGTLLHAERSENLFIRALLPFVRLPLALLAAAGAASGGVEWRGCGLPLRSLGTLLPPFFSPFPNNHLSLAFIAPTEVAP